MSRYLDAGMMADGERMKVMSRSDSPELRLIKKLINHWTGAIDGSSLGNKDALKECIPRHQQPRPNRRAELVKREQLRITCVKKNSLIILELVKFITDAARESALHQGHKRTLCTF